MTCAYVPLGTAYLQGMLGYIDCQAQTIGEQGFLALAAPGSVASLILTGLLTILVALFGYRMLFGRVPELSEATLTLVKIGIVVALATGWHGYRVLFYDVALHGPAELAAAIGAPSALPGTGGGLVVHLDLVDQQFQALAIETLNRPLGYAASVVPPPLFAGFDTFALGASRVAFLLGAVGAFAAVRLTAGLLLALGPLFIAFLLFDGTRGLFEGWLRVLAGAALGAVATTIALGIELALFEPWLADLLAHAATGDAIAGVPALLLAASLVFDIALLALIGAAARVAWGLRMSSRSFDGRAKPDQRPNTIRASAEYAPASRYPMSTGGRSRSATMIDSIAAAERREVALVLSGQESNVSMGATALEIRERAGSSPPGSYFADAASRRRTGTRVSASAGRRDAPR